MTKSQVFDFWDTLYDLLTYYATENDGPLNNLKCSTVSLASVIFVSSSFSLQINQKHL